MKVVRFTTHAGEAFYAPWERLGQLGVFRTVKANREERPVHRIDLLEMGEDEYRGLWSTSVSRFLLVYAHGDELVI